MADNRLTPAYDNKIYQKYSRQTLTSKDKNKQEFCKEFHFIYEKRVPLICMTFALTDQNGLSLVHDIMNGLLEMPVELVLTALGTAKYQKFFTDIADKHPNKVLIVEPDDTLKRKIYAASDMILVPSDSEECLKEAKAAMAYGVIPVTPATDFTKDYDPVQENGNSFIYKKGSPWALFAGVTRAQENFRFPYDWKNIQIEAMEG